jgi:hypothetical protein
VNFPFILSNIPAATAFLQSGCRFTGPNEEKYLLLIRDDKHEELQGVHK